MSKNRGPIWTGSTSCVGRRSNIVKGKEKIPQRTRAIEISIGCGREIDLFGHPFGGERKSRDTRWRN